MVGKPRLEIGRTDPRHDGQIGRHEAERNGVLVAIVANELQHSLVAHLHHELVIS